MAFETNGDGFEWNGVGGKRKEREGGGRRKGRSEGNNNIHSKPTGFECRRGRRMRE
jgi:hypothetical protein